MILVFTCPWCHSENDLETKPIESYADYLDANDEPLSLETNCQECGSFLELKISLEVESNDGRYEK